MPDSPSSQSNGSAFLAETKDAASVAGEEDDADEDDEDGEAAANGDVSETDATPANATNVKKKSTASFEEILWQIFLQDRRQTLRLKVPLGSNRSKSFDRAQSSNKEKESDSQSLPALNEPFRAGASKAQSQVWALTCTLDSINV